MSTRVFFPGFITWSHIVHSDVGLFGLDVTTDFINGANLMNNGDTIWGAVMVALPFAPVAAVGILGVLAAFINDGKWGKKGLLYGALSMVLYVPGVVVVTAFYMLFVLSSGLAKVWNPKIEYRPGRDVFLCCSVDTIAKGPPILRMVEVVGESYLQAVLGN